MRGLTGVRWVALLAIGVLVGLAAGRYVVDRPTVAAETPAAPVTFRVEEGTLGRTLRLPATGTWEVAGTIQSPAGGVITAVVTKSGLLRAGDVLLRIDERPVVLLPGDVPAFRDMRVGTRGRDVTALQRYLASQGYKVDRALSHYSTVTKAAVRRWQGKLGVPQTGVVRLGDVVFVSQADLGAPLRWTTAVATGATLGAGAPILERLAAAPTLTIEFGGSVPAQLQQGQAAVVEFPGGARRPVTLSPIRQEQGRTWATLDPTGGPLCTGAECLVLVPPSGETPLDATFTLVPETTGPLVPAAAIQSDAAGQAFVQLPDGSRKPVEVRVASGGSVIVDGVNVGDEIVLP
jgi:peptidoglycan hydrolase-like protein with peptidoglycan-binding domain